MFITFPALFPSNSINSHDTLDNKSSTSFPLKQSTLKSLDHGRIYRETLGVQHFTVGKIIAFSNWPCCNLAIPLASLRVFWKRIQENKQKPISTGFFLRQIFASKSTDSTLQINDWSPLFFVLYDPDHSPSLRDPRGVLQALPSQHFIPSYSHTFPLLWNTTFDRTGGCIASSG